jgi:hypothetical protein
MIPLAKLYKQFSYSLRSILLIADSVQSNRYRFRDSRKMWNTSSSNQTCPTLRPKRGCKETMAMLWYHFLKRQYDFKKRLWYHFGLNKQWLLMKQTYQCCGKLLTNMIWPDGHPSQDGSRAAADGRPGVVIIRTIILHKPRQDAALGILWQ